MPEAGGAQPLAGEQVVGDGGASDRVLVLEDETGMLEDALLAGGLHVDQHIAGREDRGETVHGVDPRTTTADTGATSGLVNERQL